MPKLILLLSALLFTASIHANQIVKLAEVDCQLYMEIWRGTGMKTEFQASPVVSFELNNSLFGSSEFYPGLSQPYIAFQVDGLTRYYRIQAWINESIFVSPKTHSSEEYLNSVKESVPLLYLNDDEPTITQWQIEVSDMLPEAGGLARTSFSAFAGMESKTIAAKRFEKTAAGSLVQEGLVCKKR